LINHIPPDHVKSIVTDKILEMDQRSCDNLLNAILQEKKEEDQKKRIKQQERTCARMKLANRHNMRLAQAEKIGVKLPSRSPRVNFQ